MVDLVYLSIPLSAVPVPGGNQPESDLLQWVKDKVGAKPASQSSTSGAVTSITLPDLKIGTLDNLVLQCEDVMRIDAQLQGLVFKVHDVIQQLHERPEAVARAELIDNLDAAHYLRQFGWNTAKYRPDKPISQLLEILVQDAQNADQDLKNRYTAFTAAKSNLAASERKRGGDLTVRSLDSLLSRDDIVQSDYLETVLVVVPQQFVKEFWNIYEQASSMVVPRSAKEVKAEKEFSLFTVVVFKKYASEFAQKARENKWVVREIEYEEGAADQQEQDHSNLDAQVAKLKGDVTRLASAAFSDIIKAWGHVKVIRLFVESVLRYGLPPTFATAAFVPSISTEKAESILIGEFGYLGGNAVDAKGKEEDLAEFAAVVEQDYKPFVIYVLELP